MTLQKQCAALVGHNYMLMIERHQLARQFAFQVLTLCAEQEQLIQEKEQEGLRLFTQEQQPMLAEFVSLGRAVVEELGAAVRKLLATLMKGPVVDGVILNKDHEVTGTTSFPLFPIVGDPDPAIPELLTDLSTWSQLFRRWWDAQLAK